MRHIAPDKAFLKMLLWKRMKGKEAWEGGVTWQRLDSSRIVLLSTTLGHARVTGTATVTNHG